MSKACEQCGAMFEPALRHPDQRFCSGKICRSKWEALHQYNSKVYRCQYCNKEFVPKKADRNRYCNRDCSFAVLRQKSCRGITPVFVSVCIICGCHSDKVHCSDACEKVSTKAATVRYGIANKVLRARPCKECGKQFTPEYGNKRRNYCSYRCLKKNVGRIGKAVRRARMAGSATIEVIDPLAVLSRDKWKCHMCGKSTPKRLRGTIEDNAPEMDHIIPLAKGGSHTWDNVACACRKCNQDKGDQIIGQQMLPVFASIGI